MRFIAILLSFALVGCSSVPDGYKPEYGVVHSVKRVGDTDYSPGKGTGIGAGTGATIGAVAGGVVGFAMGSFVTLLTLGTSVAAIPVCTAAGVGTGAAIGGAGGGAVGYMVEVSERGEGLYEYQVKSELTGENITVRQDEDKPAQINERVEIIRNEDYLKIKKLQKNYN